ncbi:superoxide dismutase, Cu-Zn family [Devosia enhydra]|uniref:Superoxide dismutase [Cu-Zn] n=1 Tax=Devosia enhydra TaxID=665118 RepID=A0A1K2HT10_9HYPH|nr:superoxide dismutase family protein [Devosia enhydra]SFZ81252.1 superoxide dismutase, Cu-Zn family [Devosia enhydra]
MRLATFAALPALMLAAGLAGPALAQTSTTTETAPLNSTEAPHAAGHAATDTPEQAMDRPTAAATLIGLDGETIGSAQFMETPHGVVIRLTVEGLEAGERAIHLHENGECDAAGGFESAGGHFNPTGAAHGYLNADGPHAGDMPNQFISESGTLDINIFNPLIKVVAGEDNSPDDGRSAITGTDVSTAIMIHDHADDYMTDPAGDAGGRIACGVIELAPPFG